MVTFGPSLTEKMRMRSRNLLGLVVLLASCTVRQSSHELGMPTDREATPDTSDARSRIMATSREFSARYERGDAAGMAALYTPDGVILPPGRNASSGVRALTAYWTLAPGTRVLEHRATPDSIVVAGSVAYDWGTFRVRTQDSTGTTREGFGKYVIVWRESPPGTWRMHLDIWNASPRPAPATGARDEAPR